jgi:UDP-glucuronate decarboxylase
MILLFCERRFMKLLITGGAGFLGSHLSESLLKMGHHVIAIDNLHTGSLKNIEHLLRLENFEFVNHDINSQIHIDSDGIFNLACPASPLHYQKDPIGTFYTCVFGTHNMLQLAKTSGIRILQASTSEIYGDPQISPQVESYWGNVNTIGIRSCYDEGKRAAETLFSDFHSIFSVDIRIARIFNTYGPNMAINDGRVVSNFIVQALNDEPLTIYGDGTQVRSLCYVDDLIQGIIKLFFSEKYEGPFNLGNPQPITMKDLANEIILITDSKSKVIYLPLPKDDPKTRVPDITRATEILGWKPIIDRKNGLEKTINYFKSILEV